MTATSMEPSQKELTLDESIKQVMQTLPPVIRVYLAQGKYTAVAKNLMAKYGLRIDQAGVLEREIMLLLMGIENPDEFTKALIEEARLDQKTIDSIVQDINMQIFVPLREEERKNGTMVTPEPAKPVMPQPRQESTAAPASVSTYAPSPSEARQLAGVVGPPPQSPKYLYSEDKIISSRPAQPPHSPVVHTTPPLEGQTFQNSKPIAGNKLLEDHEEPHIEFAKAPMPSMPRLVTPVPPPSRPMTPSPNLPSAVPPPPSSPQSRPATPPVRPYASDPYREPVDEN